MTGVSLDTLASALTAAPVVALVFSMLLAAKAVRDYSRTGPQLRKEVVDHYRLYALWATARLGVWAFLVAFYWALAGVLAYVWISELAGAQSGFAPALAAAAIGLALAISVQAGHFLVHNPAVIAASSHYRMSRLNTLWRGLDPQIMRNVKLALATSGGLLTLAGLGHALARRDWAVAVALAALTATLVALGVWAARRPPARVPAARRGPHARPNILMIGSDTLRADRLGVSGYKRALTPALDALAARGTWFENCYVPCGRTAPSLLTLLTGTWPYTHGVRDNFVADAHTRLQVPALPALLADAGYRTVAISDWCGADLGKFDLGFQELDLPADSWNIRYLLRQGPKDLRLFLSLFTRNRLGKRFLPEIYYQGGVPTTDALGRDARARLSALAGQDQPFLLNVFFSTTHPPFGSEHPYYTLYSAPDYTGESKFVMARLTDPFEIIRRQGEPRREFDLDQILDLYDGCVRRFDDEVQRLLAHLDACGLADNTIVVVYSDHGMEFFEHETWGQGNSVLGDHSARIPLIVCDPRHPGGHRINAITRSVDLAPTLLELAGLPRPPQMEGVSLAACLDGTPPPPLTAYSETGIWITDLPGMPAGHLRYPDLFELLDVPDLASGTLAVKHAYRDIVIRAKDRMIRQGDWKLTRHPLRDGEIHHLFDLAHDPGCQHDVSAKHPEILARLRTALDSWLARDMQDPRTGPAAR